MGSWIDEVIYKKINNNHYMHYTSISGFGQIMSELYNTLQEEGTKEELDKLTSFIDSFLRGINKEKQQVRSGFREAEKNLELYGQLVETVSSFKGKSNKRIFDWIDIFMEVPNSEQMTYIKASNTIIKADNKSKVDSDNLTKLLYASDMILSFDSDSSTRIRFFNKLLTNIISIDNLQDINTFFTEVGLDAGELKVINKWVFRRSLEKLTAKGINLRADNRKEMDSKDWLYKSLEINSNSDLGQSVDELYDNLRGWNNKKALEGFEDFINNLLYRAKKGNNKGRRNSLKLLNILQAFDEDSLEDYKSLFSTISFFKKANYDITFNWIDAFAKMDHLLRVDFIKATDLLLSFDKQKKGRNLVDFEYTVNSILGFKISKKDKNILLDRFLKLIIGCINRYEVNDIFDKIGVSNGRHIERRRLEKGVKGLNN